jgi:hypothetical protein
MKNVQQRAISGAIKFFVTTAIAIAIFLTSCTPKMGCRSPQNEYWELRGITKD